MSPESLRALTLAFPVAFCLSTIVASAQSNVESNGGVQFDFVVPGARSLAMGGAFIGMADDATASFTNPAGLRNISRKELSFEVRTRSFETLLASRGHEFGSPSGRGIDTVPGIVNASTISSAQDVTFVSFVYPRPKWAVAAYRHQLANFASSVTTEGFFITRSDGGLSRRLPVVGTMSLEVVGFGAAGSFLVLPSLSLGAGVTYYDFALSSTLDRFGINDVRFTTPIFYGSPNYSPGNRSSTDKQDGAEGAIGVNAGIAWAPAPRIKVGAVFRQGVDFDVDVVVLGSTGSEISRDQGAFNVPDVAGIGVAVSPATGFSVAVDVVRVGYSQLKRRFVNVFGSDYNPSFYTIRDATEFRVGGEYVVTVMRMPIALRGGFWHEPEHAMIYNGPSLTEQLTFRDYLGDVVHSTFGGGIAFRKLEINAGVDLSKRVNTGSVSTVVRF